MTKREPDIEFVICPECGFEQADMGNNVQCEECDYGPMPTKPKERIPQKRRAGEKI